MQLMFIMMAFYYASRFHFLINPDKDSVLYFELGHINLFLVFVALITT